MTTNDILNKALRYNPYDEDSPMIVKINNVAIIFQCVEQDNNDFLTFYITSPLDCHNIAVAIMHKSDIKSIKSIGEV